jgi:hypothetical protein
MTQTFLETEFPHKQQFLPRRAGDGSGITP